jgi:hypothetical protein
VAQIPFFLRIAVITAIAARAGLIASLIKSILGSPGCTRFHMRAEWPERVEKRRSSVVVGYDPPTCSHEDICIIAAPLIKLGFFDAHF